MKKALPIMIFALTLIIGGCTNTQEIESEIIDMEDTIYKCNNQIEDAKSHVGGSYEEIEEALNNLETCK